ncbi:MAG: hypothetical protein CL811_10515 [Colwelliaceae bacterium]|jgi:hypothetical protein|nr:hypothetical protein [Colwelliaceae bacterium]|tara:strand:+ start:399 stop:896 length:498 start_codon:yes stop_codon:yes gene_type:complete
MRTKTINVYKYEELSEKAKEKALDWYRETNDYPFLYENLEEDLKIVLKDSKIRIVSDFKLFYSLSHCQGDGLCFVGVFDWKHYKVYIEHIGNYYHSNSVKIVIETRFGNEAKEEVYKKFTEMYKELCDGLEKRGYDEIDWEDSEDTIKDTFECSEYEFDENGEVV